MHPSRCQILNSVPVIVYGIRRGYAGLIENEIDELTSRDVGGIIRQGGTILRSARSKEFTTPDGQARALDVLRGWDIDGLVVIGGDGSLNGAACLVMTSFPVIGIPASIDNDIPGTEMAIGVDTALGTILDAMDKIKDTASAHQRVFIVEYGQPTVILPLCPDSRVALKWWFFLKRWWTKTL